MIDNKQFFCLVLFVKHYEEVLTQKSVDKTLPFDHSNESEHEVAFHLLMFIISYKVVKCLVHGSKISF